MRIFLVCALIIFAGTALAQNGNVPIGMWKEYLPYNSTIDIAAGDNKIFAATPYSIFSIDLSDRSIERSSRITGLSETGVNAIHYDEQTKKLLIAYSNSNIDIIYRSDIFNIPDIKRENISGDKSIYNIYLHDGIYYLSTGLGIILVDQEKYEIKDSWIIGASGNNLKVNGFSSDGVSFFAATDEGLKSIAATSANPANYLNWQLESNSSGLPAGACRDVAVLNNKLLVLKNDSVMVRNGNAWSLFYSDGNPVTGMNVSGGKLTVSHRLAAPVSSVVVLNEDGAIERTIQQNGVTPFPRKAIIYQGNFWIADQFNAVSEFSSNTTADEVYAPNSPEGIASGDLVEYNQTFYAAAGEVNDSWNYQYNGNGVYRLTEQQWKNFNRFHFPVMDTVLDIIALAADPLDGSLWAGSFGGGLVHLKTDESIELFKQNTALQAPAGDPGSYRIAGLAFDQEQNLWMSNFGSAQPLVVRKPDGSFKSFSLPFALAENALSQIVTDDADQLWIVSPLGNGLVHFNHGNNVDDVTDDHWKLFRNGAGNGNLPSANVLSIAKDRSGFIWVGTDDGIGIIQCPQEVFATGCEAILPLVQQGNFANYLFKGENVQSIAVDGADRKWIGTRNGAWLISATGEKTLEHFTEDNSPLLSNDVKKIAVNSTTGEVYFATTRGICSFRGSATTGPETNSNVIVFPNPVPPGFSGTIAIRGLAENSIVKITETDGRLVYQTRSFGGQATWNGKDYRGRRISTGVYLVLVSTDDKTEKTAAKIVFISR